MKILYVIKTYFSHLFFWLKKFLVKKIIFVLISFFSFSLGFGEQIPLTCNQTEPRFDGLIQKFSISLNSLKNNSSSKKPAFIVTQKLSPAEWIDLQASLRGKSDIPAGFFQNAIAGAGLINFLAPLKASISSLYGSINLLANEKVAKRERQKVLDLEQKSLDLGSDLSKRQLLYNTLSQQELDQLNTNFLYQQLNLKIVFQPGTRYIDIINFNQSYSYFLKMLVLYFTTNTQDGFDASKFLEMLDYQFSFLTIVPFENPQTNQKEYINLAILRDIKTKYFESTGLTNKCPTNLKATLNNFEKIVQTASEDGAKSITKINQNFNLLRQVFNRLAGKTVDQAYLDREKQLREQYGFASSAGQRVKFNLYGLDQDWKTILQKQSQNDGRIISDYVSDTKNANQYNNFLIKEKKEFYEYQYASPSISDDIIKRTENLRGYFDNGIDLQTSTTLMAVNYDVKNITFKMPIISYNIYQSIDAIGRRGDSKEKGILPNLGKACELQCSNIPSKCRSTIN